jgi:hypothetical protein
VPGVGKSTFIEALGLALIGKGHKVAVLAIDPSSSLTGGSILGDKTRMEHLSLRSEAFIRPSPSSGSTGRRGRAHARGMLVCEAAGFDVVIVETVGVGQSRNRVAGMTDVFVLLQLPNAGDDLQAIKKGIVELADIVVYNKCDIDPDRSRTRACSRCAAHCTCCVPHRPDGNGAGAEGVGAAARRRGCFLGGYPALPRHHAGERRAGRRGAAGRRWRGCGTWSIRDCAALRTQRRRARRAAGHPHRGGSRYPAGVGRCAAAAAGAD